MVHIKKPKKKKQKKNVACMLLSYYLSFYQLRHML